MAAGPALVGEAVSDDGATPYNDLDDSGSGPFCPHWDDPVCCKECAQELLKPEMATLEARVTLLEGLLREVLEKWVDPDFSVERRIEEALKP